MRFKWDPDKERRNIAKHGFAFSMARRVLEDPNVLTVLQGFIDGEKRRQGIGVVDGF